MSKVQGKLHSLNDVNPKKEVVVTSPPVVAKPKIVKQKISDDDEDYYFDIYACRSDTFYFGELVYH